jgi:RNA polymerase sigma-70 factor (ECF subfamily)
MANQAGSMEAVRLGEARPAQGVADANLAARARQGEAAAFEELYARYRDQVYGLCLNLMGDRDDAQDLLQETFLRAYRALPRFRGASRFGTWLFRIAVNACNDAMRKRRQAADPVLTPASPDGGAEATVARVRDALCCLQAKHRVVLALRYNRSLSYQEIAEVLGWSLPRVRVTIHRAKHAFREAYLRTDGEMP